MPIQKQWTFDWHTGINIKRSVGIHTWQTYEEPDQHGMHRPIQNSSTYSGLLIGIGRGAELRIRYPDYSHSKINRLTTASSDLKSLCALFICGLVPAGVVADRIEEEFECHREAAEILRLYERVKLEQEAPLENKQG